MGETVGEAIGKAPNVPGWGRASLTAHRQLANELLGGFKKATLGSGS